MLLALGVALLGSPVFGLLAPILARRGDPATSLRLLTACGALCTGCALAVLGAVAVLGLGRTGEVAGVGHWSAQVLAHGDPFSLAAGVLATALVVVLVASGTRAAVARGARIVRSWALAREYPTALAVLPTEEPLAFALPGWPGRTVVSVGLLRTLDTHERRAVLAHERVHLAAHHELHLFVAGVCAAANPFLRGLPAASALACERAADEGAARAGGDRAVVARAIGRAAGALAPRERVAALSVAASMIPERVAALLAPPSPRRPLLTLGCLTLAALVALATGWELRDALRLTAAADAAADRLRGNG